MGKDTVTSWPSLWPQMRNDISSVSGVSWRWLGITAFVAITSLNFLDRQLLAALAPEIRSEFRLTNAEYGILVSAFSLSYTLMAPFAGWLVDRVRLARGVVGAVAAWSLAGIATGLSGSFATLGLSRMCLGAAEAAGVPAASKSVAVLLQPREFGLGIAVNTVGVMVGMSSAPLIVSAAAPYVGWRGVFVATGLFGFLCLPPVWLLTSRSLNGPLRTRAVPQALRRILRNRLFWAIIACNALVMVNYSLWLNWTTIFLVDAVHLTPSHANRYYAWIPPVFATLGGLLGGALGWRAVRRESGKTAARARARLCVAVAPTLLTTALVPLSWNPHTALIGICASVFSCMLFLPNLQAITIDVFGAGNAAFTTAMLASSYALAQMLLSPAIGAIIDRTGFTWIAAGAAAASLLAVPILLWLMRACEEERHEAV